jgi:transposase-like protein
VGRRQVKEFRAPETLALIDADRERQPLVCPYCNDTTITREPPHSAEPAAGRVTLTCTKCRRSVSYLERAPAIASNPFAL